MHITPVSSGLRRLLAPALLLALPVLMTACGGGKATRPAPPPPTANWPKTVPDNPEAANSVLMRAISLVGTPYRYGGNTPDSGFDCSGLVAYV
ncbi:NlpC/P60 family protein, partial [Stenotrophomonas maltophilia]